MTHRAQLCAGILAAPLVAWLSCATVACGDDDRATDAGRARDGGGRSDGGGRLDGSPDDGSPDDGSPDDDAASDASTVTDASTLIDAAMDASADLDSSTGTDGGTDAGPAVLFQCVPPMVGNETSAGLVLSADVWPGFRFQVTGSAVTTTSMGLNVESPSAGTVFGAIVSLSGMTDGPDAPDLTSGDVLATTSIALPGSAMSTTASGSVSVALAPGWYMAVFGTGAFGATLASATVHSNSGDVGCSHGFGYPFSIRQSDGLLIPQAATPHFFVDGAP